MSKWEKVNPDDLWELEQTNDALCKALNKEGN